MLYEVWYVVGDTSETLWATKMDAEKCARYFFPDEAPDARYARVRCHKVCTWVDA